MKKCPFCAEEIQSEAIYCRYCRKELAPGILETSIISCPNCNQSNRKDVDICVHCGHLLNESLEQGSKKHNQTPQRIDNVTLDELMRLVECIAESYEFVPAKLLEKYSPITDKIAKGYLAELIGDLAHHGLITTPEIAKVGLQASAYFNLWATICFVLGKENSLESITQEDLHYYLNLCTKPIETYILEFLDILVSRRKIRERRSQKLRTEISNYLSSSAISLSNQGKLSSGFMNHKFNPGVRSAFAQALLKK